MIGVAIPVHDEEHVLAACLESVRIASRHERLRGERVAIVVALDACSDGSAAIAERAGVIALRVDSRNVGRARAAAADMLVALGARWLAFTDADTRVDAEWLADQISLDADAVCGTVDVSDWSEHAPEIAKRWRASYRDADGHRHVHGANLGVSAEAYRRAGGFLPLASGEDVALVDALIAIDARVVWSAVPRVWTSARRAGRAPAGFAKFLAGL